MRCFPSLLSCQQSFHQHKRRERGQRHPSAFFTAFILSTEHVLTLVSWKSGPDVLLFLSCLPRSPPSLRFLVWRTSTHCCHSKKAQSGTLPLQQHYTAVQQRHEVSREADLACFLLKGLRRRRGRDLITLLYHLFSLKHWKRHRKACLCGLESTWVRFTMSETVNKIIASPYVH